MAGSTCRVKVVVKKQTPFWMIIDAVECPHIGDVEKKISKIQNVGVQSLYVDDCLLPSCERSVILRENDEVLVKTLPSGSQAEPFPDESGLLLERTSKKKKRKHREIEEDDISPSAHSRPKKRDQGKLDANESEKRRNECIQDNNAGDILTLNDAEKDKGTSKSETPTVPITSSETQKLSNAVADVADDVNESISEGVSSSKRKRKRKHSKKRNSTANTSVIVTPQDEQCKPVLPTVLRLPHWQQPKSKKIVFSSDEEVDAQNGGHFTEEDCSNFKDASATNGKDKVNSAAETVSTTGGMSVAAVSARDKEKAQENTWKKNHCRKKENVSKLQHIGPPVPKTSSPANVCPNLQHQSDLAEFLRMSPEERGVSLPPCMQYERLPNGAMMYTRVPPPKGYQRAPSSWNHHPSTPWELSKQEQLATVATNRSIVIKNSKSQCKTDYQQLSETASADNIPHTQELEPSAAVCETGPPKIEAVPLYRDYSRFPDLTSAPKVGDQIAYKVLELGEDYTPGESDYKEAEVLYYDSSSRSVTVKILSTGLEQKKKKPGRFDLPDECSAGDDDTVTLDLASMLAAKLMTMGP